MDIAGCVVVITGAGSGIGAAMAGAFADAGAVVVVTDIDGERASEVAGRIGGVGRVLDVSDERATRDLVHDIERDLGRIDIVCLNAGIATAGDVFIDDDEWRRTIDVNVMAHIYALRAVLPGMLARGHGYVVTTASAAGLLTNLGAAPYTVSKHAAVALAEWVAITYGRSGIGVSCVCPQFVDTPMLGAFSDHSPRMQAWVSDIAIDAAVVADATVQAVRDERFLVLPHPEVADYVNLRANDRDRWIAAMQTLQDQLDAGPEGIDP